MTKQAQNEVSGKVAPRRNWVTPAVGRMKASDAETGPNPINSEGPIALGS